MAKKTELTKVHTAPGSIVETDVPITELTDTFAAPPVQQPKQAPTVGRIVHFTHDEGRTSAAVVTDVNESTVALHVFYRTGVSGKADIDGVPFSEDPADGHWSWPPRA